MGEVKSYQGGLVLVAQDNGDGTSEVATLQQVATADLFDVTATGTAPAAAPAEPSPPPADVQAKIDDLEAQIAADQEQISQDQATIADLQAQLGQPQPTDAPGA